MKTCPHSPANTLMPIIRIYGQMMDVSASAIMTDERCTDNRPLVLGNKTHPRISFKPPYNPM